MAHRFGSGELFVYPPLKICNAYKLHWLHGLYIATLRGFATPYAYLSDYWVVSRGTISWNMCKAG